MLLEPCRQIVLLTAAEVDTSVDTFHSLAQGPSRAGKLLLGEELLNVVAHLRVAESGSGTGKSPGEDTGRKFLLNFRPVLLHPFPGRLLHRHIFQHYADIERSVLAARFRGNDLLQPLLRQLEISEVRESKSKIINFLWR